MITIPDKDTVTKDFMQQEDVFADAFNFYIYNGRQVIRPEQLKPMDTTAIALPYRDVQRPNPQQRIRDVYKTVIAMEDGRAAYYLGIENQSEVHYAMPVRNMLYDAMDYSAQVDRAARSHRESKDRSRTKGEFLSGFYRTDKLLPIVTLTVYFGPDSWDAPLDLHEMLDADAELLRFIDNYHVNLIAPANITDEEFGKFHTELCQALKFIKYSKDKTRLAEVVEADAAYRSISRRTADMVSIVTNSDLHYAEGRESVDMCEAIEGIKSDYRAIGYTEGRNEGSLETLIKLVKKGILSVGVAAVEAGMTVEEFEKKMESYDV